VTLKEHDLVDRRPVWAALANLYLDTELSPNDREHLAQALAGSPYAVAKLRRILLTEVHPACVQNLRAVAGVWSGFDPEWLEQRILRRRRASVRWPARLLPRRAATLALAECIFGRVVELRLRPSPTSPATSDNRMTDR
jgi:anti-sigma factor RsiW